jgi:predicted membrane protein (TIGR00267 family)
VSLLDKAKLLLNISSTHGIIRRYFVVNGFDGALTMLGLVFGFILSAPASLNVMINACVGAAVALGMSGLSSAYVSEVAERKRDLAKLEGAMITDLEDSAHGSAARWIPMLVALVNGFAPLSFSLLIITPLWLSRAGFSLPVSPLYLSVIIALVLVFFLGVLLGRVASISWVRSGIQTLLVAVVTAAMIYVFAG